MAASKSDNTLEALKSPVGFPEQFKSWMVNYVNMKLGEIPASKIVGDSIPTVSNAEFVAISTPFHGQRILLSAATGVLWHLRYNSTSSSAYKWEFLGGSALVDTGSQTDGTSATFVNLSSQCVAVIPFPGEYLVYYSGGMNATSVTLGDVMALELWGASTGTLDSRGYMAVNTADHYQTIFGQGKFTLLAENLQVRYSTNAVSDVAAALTVTPIRIAQS